jgi:hypothetical protein
MAKPAAALSHRTGWDMGKMASEFKNRVGAGPVTNERLAPAKDEGSDRRLILDLDRQLRMF